MDARTYFKQNILSGLMIDLPHFSDSINDEEE